MEGKKCIASVHPEHHKRTGAPTEHIVRERVRCLTFDELLAQHQVSRIDCLQIDVEGYDGENGWEIDGAAPAGEDEATQDARHAHALYDLLEQQVIPLFHERDADGIPRRWLGMVKRSLRTNGPSFSAARMVEDYAAGIYPAG